jgi:hypothetical protein
MIGKTYFPSRSELADYHAPLQPNKGRFWRTASSGINEVICHECGTYFQRRLIGCFHMFGLFVRRKV